MNIKELIAMLKELPEDTEVIVEENNYKEEWCHAPVTADTSFYNEPLKTLILGGDTENCEWSY
jgi:hypothetical protein